MPEQSRFSELTLIEAVNLFRGLSQSDFGKLTLYLSLDSEIPPGYGMSIENKANVLAKIVKDDPGRQTVSGNRLDDEIVERAAELTTANNSSSFSRALSRDGFTLTEERSIIRSLPEIADLPQANDELYSLLYELNMPVARNHLDQAIENHAMGNWESANSQMRTFLEELFNEIHRRLEPEKADAKLTGDNRRDRLSKVQPPFLLEPLGEWSGDGKNFVNGVFKRLHSKGSHPGLSDDEDCTFRLHLVLITGRHFLRRAKSYTDPF